MSAAIKRLPGLHIKWLFVGRDFTLSLLSRRAESSSNPAPQQYNHPCCAAQQGAGRVVQIIEK
jgi:hypothetical protein